MSGGGSSSKKSDKKKDEPVIPGTGPMMTQQPFMPGMDTALAQQLAAGFGGDPASFLAQFAQTYSPMQVLNTNPVAPPPTTPTPTTPAPAPNAPTPHWQGGGTGRRQPNNRYNGGRDG